MTAKKHTASPETTASNTAAAAAAPVVTEASAAAIQAPAADAHNTPRFHLAFESLKDRLRAIPDSEYVPITIDTHNSVITVLGALPYIRQLRADLVQHLPTFDITLLEFMETAAMALDYAQALYQAANEPPASLADLAQSVKYWHGLLYNDMCMLMSRNLVDTGSLDDLKGANGSKNLALDALTLCALYRQHWAVVADRTSLSPAELDEAQAAAEELSVAVGARERAPEVAAQAVRDRQAAFTLFMNSYDEICAAVGFIRRKQGDADTIAPSLYVGRSSKKKPAETTDAKPPAPAVATPTATATPTQPSTTTTSPMQPAKMADLSEDGPFMHQ